MFKDNPDFIHKISEPIGRYLGNIIRPIFELITWSPYLVAIYYWFELFDWHVRSNDIDIGILEFILYFLIFPIPFVFLGLICSQILTYMFHQAGIFDEKDAIRFGLRKDGRELTDTSLPNSPSASSSPDAD